ncbi:MAG: MFS transporter [Bacteroidaceae bacterium]|nr:MFS transporter [Bacteroidaceae bacterium]
MEKRHTSPWFWVPSLYIAEGLPYVIVTSVAVIFFKSIGLSNDYVTFYASWLSLPWVIKPFWAPLVEVLGSKRWWIVTMQLFIGASLAGVALTVPTTGILRGCLAFFWLMAFSSATHDIAADGFYMIALDDHEQSFFVGIRSTFYRLATLIGQGGIVALAGWSEVVYKVPSKAWSYVFIAVAVIVILIFLYHSIALPHPEKETSQRYEGTTGKRLLQVCKEIWQSLYTYVTKQGFVVAVLFMLLYRLPEAFLVKICPLFLLDPIEEGGLGLSKVDLGFAQGTVGVIGLTVGGIIGGLVVSVDGFKKWLWPMVLSITLPDVVYIILAYYQVTDVIIVSACIGIEQFGYGFGFTAYMLYMLYFSRGKYQSTHYALCTGLMALSMMLPGMVSGWLQERMGYLDFFILAMALTVVTFAVTALLKIDPEFGKKKQEQS